LKNKKHILELRNSIPIGLTTAQKLLEKTKYNVQEAETIWKVEQINSLAKKISVMPEEASELLQYVKFEFTKALSLYRERNTTDIEKILEISNKEQQILADFWLYISKYLGSDVNYGEWIHKDGFQQLPEQIKEILIIWEWYAFFDHEGVSVEQKITKDVIRILDYKLELNEFAKDLQNLKDIMDQINQKNEKNNLETRIELRNQLISSKEYVRIDNKIQEMEELVMEKTYQYLFANSEFINKKIT